jgi:hypothetical protein
MRHPHRSRRAASLLALPALVAGLAFVVLAPAAPAIAGDPVSLDGRYVVDDAGVLDSGEESAVQDALDELAVEQGVNLFVVYTDSFTNPSDRTEWTDEVARINQLGTDDVLLAVAVDDRLYQLSVDNGFALDSAELATVDDDYIVPALRDSDWAGAAIGAADGLATGLGGSPVSGGGTSSGDDDGRGAAWSGIVWVIAVIVIVLVVALIAIVVIRRRRSIDSTVTEQAAAEGPTQKELDQRVGAVLVDLDDAVTSSEEELGFAVAQFGAEATAPFRTALDEVKTTLRSAFEIKQKLDDAVPDTAGERRDWSQQIIAMCDQASDRLDAELESFTALRALERDPAPAVAAARAAQDVVEAGTADAETRLAALAERYDAAAIATVRDNVAQAGSLARFAEGRLTEADAAITGGDTAQAALRIREAQQASAQATTLLSSVAALERDLGQAAEGLAAAIDDAQLDVTEAAAVPAGTPGTPPELDRLAQAVGVELGRARSTGARDPLNARISLERVGAPLDAALAAVRGERDRQARLVAQRDRAIASAQSEVAAAQSYLQTRRGAVGPDARTRLSEAERHLQQAISLATTDPEASLREATSASQLASLASSSAQQDVSWAGSGGPGGGGGSGWGDSSWSGNSRSDDDDFGGALLGGIIGSLLGDGDSSSRSSGWSGGWGGGNRGGGWSSGRSSSSSRRSSGGSFGGGRSSSRSSSRSSGRRGGGGRF